METILYGRANLEIYPDGGELKGAIEVMEWREPNIQPLAENGVD